MKSVLDENMQYLSQLSCHIDLRGKEIFEDDFYGKVYDDPEHLGEYHLNRVVTDVRFPLLTVFKPEKSNGTGILVIPGGGYQAVMFDKEGTALAPFFLSEGYTLFVLTYRLPSSETEEGKNRALNDAVQALSLIKRNAEQWALKKDKIGVLGFSAGGHIAASLVSYLDRHGRSECPDFAGLIYPVISMSDEITHQGSKERLLGLEVSDSTVMQYSIENCVTNTFPPVFLLHCCDDPLVPVNNSLKMFQALLKHNVPVEMHLFQSGGHGFGVQWASELPVHVWPELFVTWLKSRLS
ncbi:alpha/beta hydrolase [Escherichia coli]|nr:alpha/beta hydrolase [Escherichia coli]HAO9144255.1 alpha/beta hydrolase [Escherichia coli]